MMNRLKKDLKYKTSTAGKLLQKKLFFLAANIFIYRNITINKN